MERMDEGLTEEIWIRNDRYSQPEVYGLQQSKFPHF